jgi:hypothetical protein
MTAGSAADAAIRCQDAPGSAQPAVYWSWREVEGKRCWFISVRGATPPKSAFTWAIQEPIEKDVAEAPGKTKPGPAIQMLRVKPDKDLSDVRANWLDDAPVDLIIGGNLRGDVRGRRAMDRSRIRCNSRGEDFFRNAARAGEMTRI